MKKPTLDTIAQNAGVSKSTVSYVISGKRKISRDVVNRVRQEMEKLNYAPRKSLQEMPEEKSTHLVGLHVPILQDRLSDDLFYYPVIEGVMDSLEEENYGMLVTKKSIHSKGDVLADLTRGSKVDGIILMNPLSKHSYLDYLKTTNIPFVIIGTPVRENEFFYVDIDAASAAYRASSYLINLGHKKIFTFIAPSDYIFIEQLMRGLTMAYGEHGIPIDESYITHNPISMEAGYQSCINALNSGKEFTALIIQNEVVAKGAIIAIQERGLRIPEDIALISMGGNPLARYVNPKITTIDFCPYDMGFQAGKMIMEVIAKKRLRPSHTILPTKFIKGETC